MKKVIVQGADIIDKLAHSHTRTYSAYCEGPNSMIVSDGYHTFDELYNHRHILFIALCKKIAKDRWSGYVWRSKKHFDGTSFEGMFIMGINVAKGEQITYHIPDGFWDRTNWVETLDKAPEWDKHNSLDVLDRIEKL